MAFTHNTIDFLFENKLHDSRDWYKEHKDDYEKYIRKPFTELILQLEPVMTEIDSQLICSPKKISRLYRDARFAKGKSLFRDNVWCSICKKKEPFQCVPEYYFYVSVNGFGFGCGYYNASAKSREAIRDLILSSSKEYKAAQRAYDSQTLFKLEGEQYKRNHYPERSEAEQNWLNRKSISVSFDSADSEMLFSNELGNIVGNGFKSIAPIYELFSKAESQATL